MKYQKQIHGYLQTHREEIVEELKNLVKIPSVQGQAEENAPFGKDCAKILQYVQKLYQENEYQTELNEKGGYLLSYFGNGKKSLGLFAHADTVAAGEDWIYTQPFEPIEKDGFLIGRGVLDDKCAVVSSLYILKMLKELNIPLKSKIVCYTGGNEESGMQDVRNYIAKHTPPIFSLVLDTAFPLYSGNKGVLRCMLTSDVPMCALNDFFGGKSTNITLGKAHAKLPYKDEVYTELKTKETGRVKVDIDGDEILLTAEGISKHGALPEGALNAGYLLVELLLDCTFLCQSDKMQMEFLSQVLSDIYGETLGIANQDADFGKLTCSNGIIKTENGRLSFSLDIRFGKSVQVEDLQKKLTENLKENGFTIEFLRAAPAHITNEDNEYIRQCLRVYKEFTGDKNARSYINAGGTYAMYLPCAAEVGTTTIWGSSTEMPDGHGGAHQPDECISIDGLLEAIEIAALMLLACDEH